MRSIDCRWSKSKKILKILCHTMYYVGIIDGNSLDTIHTHTLHIYMQQNLSHTHIHEYMNTRSRNKCHPVYSMLPRHIWWWNTYACVHNITCEHHCIYPLHGNTSSVHNNVPYQGSHNCILVIHAPLCRIHVAIAGGGYDGCIRKHTYKYVPVTASHISILGIQMIEWDMNSCWANGVYSKIV